MVMLDRIVNGVYIDRVKEARIAKDKTMRDMATAMGYNSPMTYSYIESGRTNPTLAVINAVSELLGKPPGYFFAFKYQEVWACANGVRKITTDQVDELIEKATQ